MIQREELEQILNFVGRRWIESTKDPSNKTLEGLPSKPLDIIYNVINNSVVDIYFNNPIKINGNLVKYEYSLNASLESVN